MGCPVNDTTRPTDRADRRFKAHQDFVLAAKVHWSTRLFPALKAAAQSRVEAARERGDPPPDGPQAVAALLADEPLRPFYDWLERHLQQMKYSGRDGLAAHHGRNRAELLAWLAQADALPTLALDDSLRLPSYYTSFDVHQHPGGLAGDALAGVVYEHGARSTTPLLQRHEDLHHRLTRAVMSRTTPRHLLLKSALARWMVPARWNCTRIGAMLAQINESCTSQHAATMKWRCWIAGARW